MAAKRVAEYGARALHFVGHPDKIKVREYVVLVTNADYSLEHPKIHLEVITSRPLLLNGVATWLDI